MTTAAQNRATTRYTVELDSETAGVLRRAAEARQTTVENLIASAAARFVDDDEARLDITPEQAAECYAGIAAIERGEGSPHERVMAETKAKFGW